VTIMLLQCLGDFMCC